MSLSEILSKLEDDHERGVLSDEEYAAAKSKAIEEADAENARGGRFRETSELEQLRTDFIRAEKPLIINDGRKKFRPTSSLALSYIILGPIFGIAWFLFTSHAPLLFRAFGPIMGIVFIVVGIQTVTKAKAFTALADTYEARRDSLVAKEDHEQSKHRKL